MSTVCATPPHLEGATLQQIPLDSLNCDGNINNNENVLQQLEIRSKQTNLTYAKRLSDQVRQIESLIDMDGFLILINFILDNFKKDSFINGLWIDYNMER